jgi:O-antigen/teichoic acid export membrane protein
VRSFTKIFQQTFWQILGKVVTSLSTFIILGLVTRNYGQAGTGVFTLALTYLGIFYLLADFGFNAHILRRAKEPAGQRIGIEWQKLLGTRLIWSAMLTVVAVGLLPFWPFSSAEFMQSVAFGSLAIIASGVFVTSNLVFQGALRYELSAIATVVGTVVSLALFLFFTVARFPVTFLPTAHLIGWIVIALAALRLVRKLSSAVIPIYDLRYTINLFKQSWPVAATLALNVIYFRADAFMIAYFKSASDVGIYNVAYSVFQSALVLPTFIMNAYYPMMLKSFKGIRVVLFGLAGLSLLGIGVTFILAPLIINILTGGGFDGSIESLRILSLGFPAYFLSSLMMWILIARGRYKLMLLLYMSGLVVNLILNLIYIPQYSFLAASWITVISEYLILILQIMVLSFKR